MKKILTVVLILVCAWIVISYANILCTNLSTHDMASWNIMNVFERILDRQRSINEVMKRKDFLFIYFSLSCQNISNMRRGELSELSCNLELSDYFDYNPMNKYTKNKINFLLKNS